MRSVSPSVVSDSATSWTVAHQAPLSVEFSMQEYCVGCHSLLQGMLPDPGIERRCPALLEDSLPFEPPGEPLMLGKIEGRRGRG